MSVNYFFQIYEKDQLEIYEKSEYIFLYFSLIHAPFEDGTILNFLQFW